MSQDLTQFIEFSDALALVQGFDEEALLLAQRLSEPQFARVNPVPKSLLGALPKHRVLNKEAVRELGDRTCSICLDGYAPRQHYLELDCGHGFHKVCVHRWFTKYNRTCPVCRKDPFSA